MKARDFLVVTSFVVCLFIIASLIVFFIRPRHDVFVMRHDNPVTLTGTVTDTSNGCAVDGTCTVTLDNSKTIITGCGLGAAGASCAPYNQESLRIGDNVRATVIHDGDAYSLGSISSDGNASVRSCNQCTIEKL
jgi:hypothetical protein